MNDLMSSVTGLAAIAAAALAATGGDVPDSPPALIALAIALVPGLGLLGRELGKAIDTFGVGARVRNRAGKLLSWDDALGAGGVALGLVVFATLIALAIL